MEAATLSTEAYDTAPARTENSPPDMGLNSSFSNFSFLEKEGKTSKEGKEELDTSLMESPNFPCKLQEPLPSYDYL